MQEKKRVPIQHDWFSKTAAGVIGGGILSIIASGLLARLCAEMPLSQRGQLAMWLMPPIWLGILGSVYFFRSGKHAWLWLEGMSLLLGGLLFWLRHT